MAENNLLSKLKSTLYPFITLIFVYILLSEFVLPVNDIIPKPSLLVESYDSLLQNYNLLSAAGITTTVVYLSLILGTTIFVLTTGILIKIIYEYSGIINGIKIFRYVSAIIFVILFSYWFGDSLPAEFLFAFAAVVFLLSSVLHANLKNVKTEYVLSARSLGLNSKVIYSRIIWKSLQPKIFNSLTGIHFVLWGLVVLYEFVSGVEGFGNLFRIALNYQDLAAIFALLILVSLLIFLGTAAIKYFVKKMIFWEA